MISIKSAYGSRLKDIRIQPSVHWKSEKILAPFLHSPFPLIHLRMNIRTTIDATIRIDIKIKS